MTDIDTGTGDLLASVDEGVLVLTMNRPDRRNAMSDPMLGAMARLLADAETDDAIRCVVLTGAGGAFCAGGDIKVFAAAGGAGSGGGSGSPRAAVAHRQRVNQRATSGRLWAIPKPTVAAIPGPAAGAGLALALACDLRYATPDAVLTTAFARVALAGDYGGTWLLTQLVGPAKAKELYYFSPRLRAEEAERLGLVNAVFDAERFEAEVMARARQLAAGPAIAYRFMKENINRAAHDEFVDCMDVEVSHHFATSLTEDHREASQAFVEKRDPQFHGR